MPIGLNHAALCRFSSAGAALCYSSCVGPQEVSLFMVIIPSYFGLLLYNQRPSLLPGFPSRDLQGHGRESQHRLPIELVEGGETGHSWWPCEKVYTFTKRPFVPSACRGDLESAHFYVTGGRYYAKRLQSDERVLVANEIVDIISKVLY